MCPYARAVSAAFAFALFLGATAAIAQQDKDRETMQCAVATARHADAVGLTSGASAAARVLVCERRAPGRGAVRFLSLPV